MKLEAGKTVIGLAFVTDEDKLNSTDFTVYYGNALEPMINNRVLHLKERDYRAMLKAFLDGKQLDQNVFWIEEGGREYDIPTEKEVRAASLEMLNREAQMLKSLDDRPIVCSECLNRQNGSGIERSLAIFAEEHVHFYVWGLYSNDRNWNTGWRKSEFDQYARNFHNMLYADGTPYSQQEIQWVKDFHFCAPGETMEHLMP